jgi:hypothetical protein
MQRGFIQALLVFHWYHTEMKRLFVHSILPAVVIPVSLCALSLLFSCSLYAGDSMVGWYNGDPESTHVVSQQCYGDSSLRHYIFDRFQVPTTGWTITGVFSQNWIFGAPFDSAFWEIRKDMEEGKGGRVVYHGHDRVQLTPTSEKSQWGLGYRVSIDGLNLQLPPGTYWLAIAPIYPRYQDKHQRASHLGVSTEKNSVNAKVGTSAIYVDPVNSIFEGLHFLDMKYSDLGPAVFRGYAQGVLIKATPADSLR